jgi:hypothetical protein
MNMLKEEKKNKKILPLLYRSFDTKLKEKEKRLLEKALAESEDLRREKELIQKQRRSLAEKTAQSFRPLFAERVMAHIAGIEKEAGSTESFYEALKVTFRRFAIAGAVVVLALLFFNLFMGDVLPRDEVFFASDIVLEEIINLPLF